MEIKTGRLLLREHRIEDYDRFWGMITDPAAKRFTGGVTSLTYEQRFKLFREDCGRPFSVDGMEFAVIEKSSAAYIGYCGYRNSSQLGGNELFYGYCQDSWGKGYGYEAADASVDFFFREIGLDHLVAAGDKDNVASCRILTRLGFRPAEMIYINGIGPVDKYELSKRDYKRGS